MINTLLLYCPLNKGKGTIFNEEEIPNMISIQFKIYSCSRIHWFLALQKRLGGFYIVTNYKARIVTGNQQLHLIMRWKRFIQAALPSTRATDVDAGSQGEI
jgi:hypothetical protein